MEWDLAGVAWTAGDAATMAYQRKVVATESATASATSAKGVVVHPRQLWSADSANTANATHNGDRMLLASGGLTVNNTGTDDVTNEACFVQSGIDNSGGKTTVILGYFTGSCDGSNPLAT